MPIYEKSTNQLLAEYIEENLSPDQTISKEQIVTWFGENYLKIKSNTVSCHIIKFTTNHHTRIHYKATPKHDFLFQLPNKLLRQYNPQIDPKPIYAGDEVNDTIIEEPNEESSEFAYESHLRDYLMNHLDKIEAGLRLYRDEEDETITGVEFDAGGKRIDILAVDSDNNFVIIELKVSRGYEKTIGQILRYKAWVRENLADDKKVKGIVIAKNITKDLKMAASELTDIEMMEYDLNLDLRKIQ